jgi:TRAP-type uncharacterized transport system substrate-binding protein
MPKLELPTTSLRREWLLMAAGALVVVAIVVVLGLRFVKPAPPKRLVVAVAPSEGGAKHYAKKYKELLAKDGITLEIHETSGSLDSVEHMSRGEEGIDVAIVPGGILPTKEDHGLVSLGSVAYVPLWIFYRGDALDDPAQLKGRRIGVGPEGSATRVMALRVLGATGADQPPTQLSSAERTEAIQQLVGGAIDALFLLAPAEAPAVQKLAREEGVRLMSVSRVRAYSRRFHNLEREVLPRGVFDLVRDVPPQDTELLTATAAIVARESVHPALVHLLLRAAKEVHHDAGVLDRLGEFPSDHETGYPLSPHARRFFETGGSLLQRVLPFWAASLIDRLWVMLLPVIAVLVPLLRLLPPIYRWRVQSRIYRWYARLKEIELEFETSPPAGEGAVSEMLLRIDELEVAIHHTPTPLSHASSLYMLREHVDLLRRKVEARRRPARSVA